MAKKETASEEAPPWTPPVAAAQVQAAVTPYTDGNWILGVTRYLPAGVLLDVAPELVKVGDSLLFPGNETRVVIRAYGSWVGGTEVFLDGPTLNPATQGAPSKAFILQKERVLDFAAEDARIAAYLAAHPNTGGVLGAIGGAFSDAAGAVGGAIGDAAGAVGGAVGGVVDVAVHSVVAQVAAAVLTGGLSLAAQAAVETATGNGGPVTGLVTKLVNDPLEVLKDLPGVLLTETGLPGLVADAASYTGSVLSSVFGDTDVGNFGKDLTNTVEAVQQAAKDDPMASLEVIAGIAVAAVGGGTGLLNAGLGDLFGGGGGSGADQGATGDAPESATTPEAGAAQAAAELAAAQAQTAAELAAANAKAAAAPAGFLSPKAFVAVLGGTFGLGLVTWALWPTSKAAKA
jgi:hypothetical protein